MTPHMRLRELADWLEAAPETALVTVNVHPADKTDAAWYQVLPADATTGGAQAGDDHVVWEKWKLGDGVDVTLFVDGPF